MPLWLESHWYSTYAQAHGIKSLYWNKHEPRIHRWLDTADAVVLCDRDAPEIVWAFAVFADASTVHYALCKMQFKDYAHEAFDWMLGDRLDSPQHVTHELTDCRRYKYRIPFGWDVDPYWVEGIR